MLVNGVKELRRLTTKLNEPPHEVWNRDRFGPSFSEKRVLKCCLLRRGYTEARFFTAKISRSRFKQSKNPRSFHKAMFSGVS